MSGMFFLRHNVVAYNILDLEFTKESGLLLKSNRFFLGPLPALLAPVLQQTAL